MKIIIKLFGIIALVGVIGFSMAACDNGIGGSIDESVLNQIRYVAENPAKGFNYGYYYYIPGSIRKASKKFLLIEPNNTGGFSNYDMDDVQTHSQAAQSMLNYAKRYADELGCVLLVPIIPRPYSTPTNTIEPQVLNRIAMQTTTGIPARVDLQLIKMIDDMKVLCGSFGISLQPKIMIDGFSAGGVFGNRFTALHPELVQAVASGGINYKPILPITTMEGERLIYPVGIADLEEIAGTPFNFAEYVKVPQFIYVGADDTNPGPFDNDEERRLTAKVFGSNSQERWETAIHVYEEQGCSAVTYNMYPGVGHEITNQIQNDILEFLGRTIGVTVTTTIQPTKFEGEWYSRNPNNPINIFNRFTFTGNNFLYQAIENGQIRISRPGTFTFTATQITLIPAQANTWQGYTQGYSLSGNQLNLTTDGAFIKE